MVKITLEYGSVEEAIQALGKLSGLAKVRRAAAATTTGAAPSVLSEGAADIPQGSVTAPAPTKQRKPRNDAGKPRGPHKKSEGAGVGAQPEPSASAAEPAAAPAPEASTPAEAASASSPPGEADAKAALEAYFDKHGPQKAMALLASFGVSKLRELPGGDRARFIEACKE